MPVCLVFGASGAIGRFLLPRLGGAGIDVLAVSRQPRALRAGLRWLVADLHGSMPALPAVEQVFSLGPLDAFAQWFAGADAVRPARIVAIGSMSIDSKRVSSDPAERDLALRLAAAEAQLAAAAAARGCALTVFRPTLIYGAGSDRSLAPIARFALRWRVFPRLHGATGLRQPVHADDLAAACLAVLGAPRSIGRTYALGGGERLAFASMLERLRLALPRRTLAVPVPLAALGGLARVGERLGLPRAGAAAIARLTTDLVADHAQAVEDFGWAPRPFVPDPAHWPRD
ncbi:NAD-dependent epimerase/dehydratase family protein [Dokdonella sp.]|uniref:NAD-dependent epimerase/dehydratase family protein n=1 Tax=Dokdonella sp. TaxID=2291710 RepID=UPI0031C859C8|nr:NAD-dependent epimerase/dehydratase family protein [Dokdonella sp.]